jgi:predicted nucleotidyltransferase
MDKIIPLRVDQTLVDGIELLVTNGIFRNRNEGIRAGIRNLLNQYNAMPQKMNFLLAKIVANHLFRVFSSIIQAIILFGSVARGTDTSESDIDLLLLTTCKVSYTEQADFYDAIRNILQGIQYDVSLHFQETGNFLEGLRRSFSFETDIAYVGKVLQGAVPPEIMEKGIRVV